MPEPRFVFPLHGELRRVARLPDALTFPAPGVGPSEDASGSLRGLRRFEDPRAEFGVLYCASSDEAAFGDDIAQYRPRLIDQRKSLGEWITDFVGIGPGPGDPEPGQIPASYFDDRVVVPITVSEGSRFVDLDDPTTHAALDEGLPGVLAEHSLTSFDRGVVMGADRRITGAIARYFYSLAQRPGFADLIGLRYGSRFAPEWERWALWGQDAIYLTHDEPMRPVTHDNPSLHAAAARLGITVPPGRR